jgi:hypothetical protein
MVLAFRQELRISAVVIEEEVSDCGRSSPFQFVEIRPALEKFGCDMGADFVKPVQHLREIHVQV